MAVLKGRIENVLLLVSLGADVNLGDNNGHTPLHTAARIGNTEAAQALIFAAGSVVDLPDEAGSTPLHMAASSGHGETVEALLSANADPNARDVNRQTPLDLADIEGHAEVARILRDAARP